MNITSLFATSNDAAFWGVPIETTTERIVMFLFVIFVLAGGVAAGTAIDQTVPPVHDFTAKYIVGAQH